MAGSRWPAEGRAKLVRILRDHGVRVHAEVLAAGNVTAAAVDVLPPDHEPREIGAEPGQRLFGSAIARIVHGVLLLVR
jgi:hypothetical protein